MASEKTEEEKEKKLIKKGMEKGSASSTQSKWSDIKDDIKKKYKIFICSTQNQMVNLIPICHFGKKEKLEDVYNITVKDSLYHANALWDRNLGDVLGEKLAFVNDPNTIVVEQSETHNVSKVKEVIEDQIEKLEDEIKKNNKEKEKQKELKILWNITGGQRSLLLAIMEIVKERKEDYICYLEGNKNKLIVLNHNNLKKAVEDVVLSDSDLDIEKALLLAGFTGKESSSEKMEDAELKKFQNFNKIYCELARREELRNFLMSSNLKNSKFSKLKSIKGKSKEEKKRELEKILPSLLQNKKDADRFAENNNLTYGEFRELFLGIFEKYSEAPFGYFLEKMAYAEIKKVAGDSILQLAHSYKINFSEDLKIKQNYQIDEFDILLLTKNGKLIVFECKSGGMSGDNAKSHKYSTYAVSGVYGKPILITPLLGNEILKNPHELEEAAKQKKPDELKEDNNKNNANKPETDTNKDYKENEKNFKALGDEYKSVKSAIRSAKRANLEVWGLDEIGRKLKDLLLIEEG